MGENSSSVWQPAAQGLEHAVVERMGWQLHLSSSEGSQGGLVGIVMDQYITNAVSWVVHWSFSLKCI